MSLCLLLCVLTCLCEKWILAWCYTKDKIQQHLTAHACDLVILATCMCDLVHNI